MTSLRKSVIVELEKVPEDKLHIIMQFIGGLAEESGGGKKKTCDLKQFVMPSTDRGRNADAYIRELRDNKCGKNQEQIQAFQSNGCFADFCSNSKRVRYVFLQITNN